MSKAYLRLSEVEVKVMFSKVESVNLKFSKVEVVKLKFSKVEYPGTLKYSYLIASFRSGGKCLVELVLFFSRLALFCLFHFIFVVLFHGIMQEVNYFSIP